MGDQKDAAGFTLIEVIVVVLVICLLTGLIVPTVMSSRETAEFSRVAQRGRHIVVSVISENVNRSGCTGWVRSIWPIVGRVIEPMYPNSLFTATSTSNDYFAWLVEDQVTVDLTNFVLFAGSGVDVAPSAHDFRTGDHNVWNIVANLDPEPVGDPPFLCTRNFHVTPELLRNEASGGAWKADALWHAEKKPFGRRRVVIVSRGAAVDVIRASDMARSRFVGNAVFSSGTNKDVAVWHAVGTEHPPVSP